MIIFQRLRSVLLWASLCCYFMPLAGLGATQYVTCIPVISKDHKSITVETLYGTFMIDEPVLVELLTCTQMERLKGVRQLGISCYVGKWDDFTRYDHSVGVWALVRKFGGSLKEQVAALLHDASHTAFSHVGAFFFVESNKAMDTYQDDAHERYLDESGIASILARHGLSVQDVHHKNATFTILEQDLPDMCADRFEYNVQGGLWEGLITREQAEAIVDAVRFEHNHWYFIDVAMARLFAQLPLIMTRTIWGSPENFLTGKWLGQAMRRAADLGILTADHVRYSTDDLVWNKLCAADDQEIQECVHKIFESNNYFTLNEQEYDVIMTGKFRGVDPWVKTESGFQRLSELDENFAREYERIKRLMEHGWHIMLTEGLSVIF